MISRRDILIGSVVMGTAMVLRRAETAFAAAGQTPVNFAVPPGAFDSHTHVIGNPQRFPYSAKRLYTPGIATVQESIALHKTLHIDRVVIVQPSFYGVDMSATLDGLRQLGPNSRGIAVIDDRTTSARLDEFHRAGVRGIRLNFQTAVLAGAQSDARGPRTLFPMALKQIAARKWHVQMFTNLGVIEAMQDEIMASPVPVVIDHFGSPMAALGIAQPGFGTLLKLVKVGKVYVKVSAPYRISSLPNYSDVAPFAKALIAANPERILWGSDWPHPSGGPLPGHTATELSPNLPIDNGQLLNLLAFWAPDAALRKTILVDNPQRLFDL